MKYSVVDLFAGAGGLSYGFEKTGKFEIKVAVENNKDAQATYKLNHKKVKMYGDVRDVNYSEIKKEFGHVDVVIGGPPCQGFSNANRQKNYTISKNNMLVKEYVRAILELEPDAFLMENVGMLKSETHRFFVEVNEEDKIRKQGIDLREDIIVLLEHKYDPQFLLEILNNGAEFQNNIWSNKVYSPLNIILKSKKNRTKQEKKLKSHQSEVEKISDSFCEMIGLDRISNLNVQLGNAIIGYYAKTIDINEFNLVLDEAISVQKALLSVNDLLQNDIQVVEMNIDSNGNLCARVQSYSVLDYLNKSLSNGKGIYKMKSCVLNSINFGAPQKRERFIIIGIKKTIPTEILFPDCILHPSKYPTIEEAIKDLEKLNTTTETKGDEGVMSKKRKEPTTLQKWLWDSPLIKNHIIPNTKENAMNRFKALKQGQNFHDLEEGLKTNTYTDTERTQNTIYLRLKYNEPSSTVVNVRKSMWIHPVLDRAISIREAARLQTFPDSFTFIGHKDSQYQQVGNAVPPLLGRELGACIANLLDKKKQKNYNNDKKTFSGI